MAVVKAKKNLGQHFLTDLKIAKKIVESLQSNCSNVLEIGPGMGVLTQFLFQEPSFKTTAIDVDRESIAYLQDKYEDLSDQIIYGDFLSYDVSLLYASEPFAVIGNFPYNISSQILFKVLDHKNQVPEVVGMFQKEVAERLASPPGSKAYGILSVLLQAYYKIEYLFTVHENVFNPPPKVKSAVIRLTRNSVEELACDEKLFKKIIKATFNNRRKMLRNTLKPFLTRDGFEHHFLTQRPEQLSVADFVELTNAIVQFQNK
ncbi:MAG: 16S rRNA (adenine(1518)-N(6)/adenine(1519)-N(6))-dimethyltransferase RsmA [Prolixibacteraceae bacterium]|jgi:16S rRNA (adenine1518-N6/adenine1519-N6)-dimethyltransferase|nr:16S rRNA (adenine(1518)-N(6)/adenine(1519)-N(6))-dimethyltransferase RsmA [Prolixibacteraceae bacterium]